MLRKKTLRGFALHYFMMSLSTIIGISVSSHALAASNTAESDRTNKKSHKALTLANPNRIIGPTAPLLNLPKTPGFIESGRNPAQSPTLQLSCSTVGGKPLKRGDAEYDECLRASQTGRTPQEPAGTWGAPGTQLWLRN